MDGWNNGWVDGWMGAWAHGYEWAEGQVDGWGRNGCTHRWMNGKTDIK